MFHRIVRQFILLALLSIHVVGCGGGDKPADKDAAAGAGPAGDPAIPSPSNPKDLEAAIKKTQEELIKANDGKNVVAVEGDKLQSLLPANLAGLAQSGSNSEKQDFGGISISEANAAYGSDEKEIRVRIQDVGPMSGIMKQGLTAFANTSYNRKEGDDFDRTGKIAGFPCSEKYSAEGKETDITIFVAGRFVVHLNATGMPFDTAKSAAAALPLAKLEAMKDQGVSK